MVRIKVLAYSVLAGTGLSAMLSAAPTTGLLNVGSGLSCMCRDLFNILPIVSMLMLIGAAVVYAAGQLMGAETRARATTWSTAMLIGALMGILIITVGPSVMQTIVGTTFTINCTGTSVIPACP